MSSEHKVWAFFRRSVVSTYYWRNVDGGNSKCLWCNSNQESCHYSRCRSVNGWCNTCMKVQCTVRYGTRRASSAGNAAWHSTWRTTKDLIRSRTALRKCKQHSASLVFMRVSIYAIASMPYMPRQFRPYVCLSVCPSVTRMYCIKMAERIIEIHSLSDRPIILVFRHQGSLCKSDGFTPNGGTKYKGVAVFNQYAAISRKGYYTVFQKKGSHQTFGSNFVKS